MTPGSQPPAAIFAYPKQVFARLLMKQGLEEPLRAVERRQIGERPVSPWEALGVLSSVIFLAQALWVAVRWFGNRFKKRGNSLTFSEFKFALRHFYAISEAMLDGLIADKANPATLVAHLLRAGIVSVIASALGIAMCTCGMVLVSELPQEAGWLPANLVFGNVLLLVGVTYLFLGAFVSVPLQIYSKKMLVPRERAIIRDMILKEKLADIHGPTPPPNTDTKTKAAEETENAKSQEPIDKITR